MKLTKTERNFSLLFIGLLLAELICENTTALFRLHYFTKPALLTALIVYFLLQSKHLKTSLKKQTLLALIFSLLGDILLMFAHLSDGYFMVGLVSFLLAHVMYIFVFLKHRNRNRSGIALGTTLGIYALVLLLILWTGLGNLLAPVILYMLVILIMALTAYLRKEKVPRDSFNLVFYGALLFLASDSILALNKFYQPVAFASVLIMGTYALAQLCIVLGILRLPQSVKD